MPQPSNWSLFYRFEGDCPQEFCELRQVGSTVWSATGKVKTWGESSTNNLGNPDEAHSEYEKLCREAEADGFVPTRSGIYDPNNFDFDQLSTEILEGARRAFSAIREAHPDQTMNAFALCSDDSAMTIVNVANSQEAFAKVDDEDKDDFLWNAAEWSFEEGGEFLDIAYRLILPYHRDIPYEIEFAEFRNGVYECCIQALEQLDEEGFFGKSPARENVILLFQVIDSDEVKGATERLNTAENYQRYRTWYDSWN